MGYVPPEMELRPLVVLTGTLHVEGGIDKKVRSREKHGSTRLVTESRKISPARRQANVVVTDIMRRIRATRLLRTPFGTLFKAEALTAVQAIIEQATKSVQAFHGEECRLANTLVWEHLKGNRRDAVAAWVAARVTEKEVATVLSDLATTRAA